MVRRRSGLGIYGLGSGRRVRFWVSVRRFTLRQASGRQGEPKVECLCHACAFGLGIATTVGPNGIDFEVSTHRTVSVSNFQSIKISTDDWMVNF